MRRNRLTSIGVLTCGLILAAGADRGLHAGRSVDTSAVNPVAVDGAEPCRTRCDRRARSRQVTTAAAHRACRHRRLRAGVAAVAAPRPRRRTRWRP